MWYYLPNGHWLLKQSIKQLGNHMVQNLRIILINLTTLNDQIIDKYLFFGSNMN